MKKYIRNILLFFVAIVVIDLLFGVVCQYLNDHSKGGGIKSRYYVCKESNEDVLIFGSSRAKHHYVPDIIEDSLSMTCYNTGEDGNGIIVRLYEVANKRTKVTLQANAQIATMKETNLIEEDAEFGKTGLKVEGDKASFTILPYEIKTFRITF